MRSFRDRLAALLAGLSSHEVGDGDLLGFQLAGDVGAENDRPWQHLDLQALRLRALAVPETRRRLIGSGESWLRNCRTLGVDTDEVRARSRLEGVG